MGGGGRRRGSRGEEEVGGVVGVRGALVVCGQMSFRALQ